MTFLKNFFAEEEGQGMVEYGLVISLVVVGGITAYTAFGNAITTGLGTVQASITAAL
jgi:pilus assembly protein Flp/PilA